MRRIISSLRFRLLLLVLCASVPAFGLVLYTSQEQRRTSATQAEEHALQLARAVARSEGDLVESTREFLSVLSQLPAIQNSDPKVCDEFLAGFLARYPRYTSITVRAKDATPLCRASPKVGPIPAEPGTAHVRALEARDFAVGDLSIGQTSGRANLPFGFPVFDKSGQVQGVIMAALDVDILSQIASQAILPDGSTITVNDRNGIILAHYPDPQRWVGKSASDVPIIRAILAKQGEGTVETLGEDNVRRLYAFTPWNGGAGNTVYVSVGIPSAVAFDQVNQALTRNLLTLGIVAVVALGAAGLGGEWFVFRQLNSLLRLTGRLAKGDLHARAGLEAGSGELAQLARAFDTMGQALEERDAARRQVEDQTRKWAAKLQALMSAVADAISRSLTVEAIADTVLAKTLNLMDLKAGGVFLRRGNDMALVAYRGLTAAILAQIRPLGTGGGAVDEIGKLVRSGAVQDVFAENRPVADAIRAEGYQSWICVPIQSKDRVFGVMCLASQELRVLETHDQGVLAAVGQQVGVAIENAELHEQVQSIAALKERERISHELHDGLAQVLGYLCQRTELAKDLVLSGEDERAAIQLQEMQVAVQEAHQDLRESVLGLRVTVSPHGGMISALNEYAHKFGLQTGIRATLTADGNGLLHCSPEAEVQLLRIIQESLANVRKHSGAKQAWIRFESQDDSITVTIEDDGTGFDPAKVNRTSPPHFGMQTMRERAEEVGGSFEVSSEPGHGTRVRVTLPIRKGGA